MKIFLRKIKMNPIYFKRIINRIGDTSLIRFRCGERVEIIQLTKIYDVCYDKGEVMEDWFNVDNINRYNKEKAEKIIGIKLLPL
jgi:hypothetical protein